jgi:hypothetical protein
MTNYCCLPIISFKGSAGPLLAKRDYKYGFESLFMPLNFSLVKEHSTKSQLSADYIFVTGWFLR